MSLRILAGALYLGIMVLVLTTITGAVGQVISGLASGVGSVLK